MSEQGGGHRPQVAVSRARGRWTTSASLSACRTFRTSGAYRTRATDKERRVRALSGNPPVSENRTVLASNSVLELFELAVEGVARDSQHRCRPCAIAVAESEGLLDRHAFQPFHRERLLRDMTLVLRRSGLREERFHVLFGDRLGIVRRESDGALQDVLEPSNVAEEGRAEQQLQGRPRQRDLTPAAAREPCDEMLGQHEDVFRPRPQRWQLDDDGGNAKVEVFSKVRSEEHTSELQSRENL